MYSIAVMKMLEAQRRYREARDVLPGDGFASARSARIDAAASDGRPRDTVAHSSVQPWSAGALFPAVIAVIERQAPVDSFESWMISRPSRSYELTIGAFVAEYATREDAEMVARWTCQNGQIIPERYAQLVKGAGKSMAAFGSAP